MAIAATATHSDLLNSIRIETFGIYLFVWGFSQECFCHWVDASESSLFFPSKSLFVGALLVENGSINNLPVG